MSENESQCAHAAQTTKTKTPKRSTDNEYDTKTRGRKREDANRAGEYERRQRGYDNGNEITRTRERTKERTKMKGIRYALMRFSLVVR